MPYPDSMVYVPPREALYYSSSLTIALRNSYPIIMKLKYLDCNWLRATAKSTGRQLLASVMVVSLAPFVWSSAHADPPEQRFQVDKGATVSIVFLIPGDWTRDTLRQSFFTLRQEGNPQPFCLDGEMNTEGLKHLSQAERFSVSKSLIGDRGIVNLTIASVNEVDDGSYILEVMPYNPNGDGCVRQKKVVEVNVPPSPAICFLTPSNLVGYDDWLNVQCYANSGTRNCSVSCFQGGDVLPHRGLIKDNGVKIKGTFWLRVSPPFMPVGCCSHDLKVDVNESSCQDFRWPREIHEDAPDPIQVGWEDQNVNTASPLDGAYTTSDGMTVVETMAVIAFSVVLQLFY